jgi:hypothetical protein
MWHWIYVLNKKKKPEQISSGSFNYLLNLDRVTSEGSRNNVSINHNWLLPEVSPLLPVSSLKEKSLLPLIWTVVGALDNYSLVFVIFINFFGQLKDWVGQVPFLVSCPKGQVEKYVNVAICQYFTNYIKIYQGKIHIVIYMYMDFVLYTLW